MPAQFHCPFCGAFTSGMTLPCPICGKASNPGRDLASTCPNCGTDNPKNYDFCIICGAPSGHIPHGQFPPNHGSYILPLGPFPNEGAFPPPQTSPEEKNTAGDSL